MIANVRRRSTSTASGLAAQYIRIREGQRFAVSGTLASMGGGLPYAIAAALAYPGRQVVAIVGDGGLGMSIAELAATASFKATRELEHAVSTVRLGPLKSWK